jgi:hypothetical protein
MGVFYLVGQRPDTGAEGVAWDRDAEMSGWRPGASLGVQVNAPLFIFIELSANVF